MTSLFEVSRKAELPVELVLRGARAVSLLEFLPSLVQAEVPVEAAAKAEQEFAIDPRAAQVAAMVEAARDEALADAGRLFEAELQMRMGEMRLRVDRLYVEFAGDRQRYFAAAEAQVVRLALAVAGRVLAREVAADPMHLVSTVRAALARVQEGSRTTLRVCPAEVEAWSALGLDRAEVVASPAVAAGECVLETPVGRVELGVQSQLKEIAHGFTELAERQGGA